MRSIGELLALALTVAAGAVIGLGVPLAWVWIGSQLQGGSGTSLDFSVAVAILFGIIISYVGVLWVAGWVMMRFGKDPAGGPRPATARSPWMRGMTDTRQATDPTVGGIERLFVVTTLVVTGAFWVWFLFFAGSSLPTQ